MGYAFDWGLPLRRQHVELLHSSLSMTAVLTFVSTAGSLLLGVHTAKGRLSKISSVCAVSLVFVEVFRGVPTLFWILFFCIVMPTLLGERIMLGLNGWSGLPPAVALAGLTLSNAAHVAEIVRAGIQALPRAQEIAGLSLGLRPSRVWWSILLPQALRLSLPALGPRMVHNFHNTSLALVVSVAELTWQTQQIEATTFRGFEAITIASLAFVSLSLLMTSGFRLLERRSARWS